MSRMVLYIDDHSHASGGCKSGSYSLQGNFYFFRICPVIYRKKPFYCIIELKFFPKIMSTVSFVETIGLECSESTISQVRFNVPYPNSRRLEGQIHAFN